MRSTILNVTFDCEDAALLARFWSEFTHLDDRRNATPGGWVVMADPEGNEFCLEPTD